MTTRKKRLASLLGLITVLVGLLVYISYYYVKSHSEMFEFTCAANLQQRDATTDFHLDASFVLTLRYSGEAMVSVDGTVHKNGKDYVLRRNAEFQYSPYIQFLYKLNHFTVHRGLRDNVPANVLNTDFSYLYITKITDMDDAVLIGTRVLPLIVCHTR
ncbi:MULTISPECIES: hypothetical protein [Pantoea]|uniref:hypothetical protein n=1 Tax=Pantoea TaxID=53335 RepID=UPI0007C855F5|nr:MULTISPECIES: hypothetical protein [Pantoea]MCH9298633.1 hypothetical protein [Pantoea allii]OAE09657.1 hypothetical protein A6A26_19490 [Pantoea sp. OXWO6B1]